MKRIFALFHCLILTFTLSACGASSFEEGKEEREKVVDLILDANVKNAENKINDFKSKLFAF